MTRILTHLQTNLIGYLALTVALSGTAYAATNLPANSVGTQQIRNGAVTATKLDSQSIGGTIRHWAFVLQNGGVLGGSRGARATAPTQPGQPYHVTWGDQFPRSCAVLANSPGTEGNGPFADTIGIHVSEPAKRNGRTAVWVWTLSGGTAVNARFYIAVVC